jgi:hypothetical protein
VVSTPTAGQYTFVWNGPAAGTHRIVARATDEVGGTGDSAPVELTVVAVGGAPRLRVLGAAGGVLQLELEAVSGTYELKLSRDLRSWSQLRNLTVGPAGSLRIDEPIPGPASTPAFYRLRRP